MRFTKMQGLGNDFLVVDEATAGDVDWPSVVPGLCDRRAGVGADGLLLVTVTPTPRMRLINADGSEAEMCGNGVRCAAVWAERRGLGAELVWTTGAGKVRTRMVGVDSVEVDMGVPRWAPGEIPVTPGDVHRLAVPARLVGIPCDIPVDAVGMGNPHAVVVLEELPPSIAAQGLAAAPLVDVAAAVRASGRFPAGANVELVAVDATDAVRQRTDERGVGETDACGTGACASVAALHRRGRVGDRVVVTLRGGPLEVRWDGSGAILMRGPASAVFSGEVAAAAAPGGTGRH